MRAFAQGVLSARDRSARFPWVGCDKPVIAGQLANGTTLIGRDPDAMENPRSSISCDHWMAVVKVSARLHMWGRTIARHRTAKGVIESTE